MRRAQQLSAAYLIFEQAEDFDFDVAVTLLVDAVNADAWEKCRLQNRWVSLPSLDDVAWPRPELYRSALDAQVVILTGDAQLGKTLLAFLLGHWRVLWRGSGRLRWFEGPDPALAALAAVTEAARDDVLVLENPFGASWRAVENPAFFDALDGALERGYPEVLVSSRLPAWQKAGGFMWDRLGAIRLPARPDRWYAQITLQSYARRLNLNAELLEEVGPGQLDTPARIRDRARGLNVSPSAPVLERDAGAVQDRVALLANEPGLGRLATLVRLQEFGSGPLPRKQLELLAGESADATPVHETVITSYEWEGTECLRLATPIDAEAVDDLLDATPTLLDPVVSESSCPREVVRAWEAWGVLQSAREDDWEAVTAVAPPLLGDSAAQLLGSSASEEALACLDSAAWDEWSVAEFAYALVRLWPRLPIASRSRWLERLLNDTVNLGAYGVVEAGLYLRLATPHEVRAHLARRLWSMYREGTHTWELALALDAYAWRPPLDLTSDLEWIREWVATDDELVKGILRFSAVYHEGGLRALGLFARAEELQGGTWTQPQVDILLRLVQWHFLHQSRARIQIARQYWVDKDFLCRTLHPRTGNVRAGLPDAIRALAEAGHGGWALFLTCNLVGALQVDPQAPGWARTRDALTMAGERDVGVLAAVATYPYAVREDERLLEGVRSYFRRADNRAALLDALHHGVQVQGFDVRRPRFSFAADPADVLDVAGIDFPRLRSIGLRVDAFDELVEKVRGAAQSLVEQNRITPPIAAALIGELEHGDLRALDLAAAAADPANPIQALLIRAAEDYE